MKVENFVSILDADFFTGVPDSLLKPLGNYLMNTYGITSHHIIAANEGNCTGIAAGYHIATGKVPVVYLQNSGIGNIINPVVSLLNDQVYGIPCIFVVGWRGEPGCHDEPQHIYQGQITIKLLEDINLETYVIGAETTEEDLKVKMKEFNQKLQLGKSVAFLIKKGGLKYEENVKYSNCNTMSREKVIECVVNRARDDILIGTTGKLSRELFEIRERNGQSHECDFLTVGSMGHSSSLALGVALNKVNTRVWCLDGDGAILMHMGAMAVIGAKKPCNLVHLVINNGAHETVGGMPTVATEINLVSIATACGYQVAVSVQSYDELNRVLNEVLKTRVLTFIEVKCALGAREDLGRPTISPIENKNSFMAHLNSWDMMKK